MYNSLVARARSASLAHRRSVGTTELLHNLTKLTTAAAFTLAAAKQQGGSGKRRVAWTLGPPLQGPYYGGTADGSPRAYFILA